MDNNYDKILASLKKLKISSEEAEVLAKKICEDAPLRYNECAGFGANAESVTSKVKEFGQTLAEITVDKEIEVLVVDNSTIEYKNEQGEQELFTFDEKTMESLGKKLEGVPVVIGKGHDADLPVAYFSKKYVIKDYVSDGKTIKGLFGRAIVRSDEDAPVVAEELFKNPRWTINGGTEKLKGSLRFSSNDIPYFFEDGSKVNYMTRPVPRHYALLDSPIIKDSGVINKNFGENKGETIMANEQLTAPAAPAATPASAAPAAPVVVTPTPPAPVAITPPTVVIPAPEPIKMVPEAELTSLKAKIAELMKEIETGKKNRLLEKITFQKFGPNADPEVMEKFLTEAGLKSFGLEQLEGYMAGLGQAVQNTPKPKNFGKGAVDATPAGTGAAKLDLYFMKKAPGKNNK